MSKYDGKISNERVLQKLIEHRNHLRKLKGVTSFGNDYIANLV